MASDGSPSAENPPAPARGKAHPAPARIFRQFAGTLGTEALTFVCSMAFSVVVTRELQPVGKGVLATLVNAVAIGSALGSFGSGKALLYYTGRDDPPRGEIVGGGVALVPAGAAIATATALVLAPSSGLTRETWMLIALLATATIATGTVEALLRGLRQLGTVNLTRIAQSLGQLALLVGAAALLSLDYTGALVISLVASLLRLLLLVGIASRSPELRPSFAHWWRAVRTLTTYGATYQVYALLWVTHCKIDAVLLERLQGPASTGLYSTAANLAQLLWRVPTALTFVTLPYLSQMKEAGGAMSYSAGCVRLAAPVLVGLAVVGALLSDPLMILLYGPSFAPASQHFRILLPGVIAAALHMILTGGFVADGRLGPLIRNGAWSLAANLAFNMFLIPRYAGTGAALASCLSYSLLFILTLVDVQRVYGIGWRGVLVADAAVYGRVRTYLFSRGSARRGQDSGGYRNGGDGRSVSHPDEGAGGT